jgi:hypothetical protein
VHVSNVDVDRLWDELVGLMSCWGCRGILGVILMLFIILMKG